MKFFHLSDLHIGLKLMNRDLREEQMDILRQVTDLAREEQPDAVVIAGDIYDKAVPAAEAVEVFDSFITELKRAVRYLSSFFRGGRSLLYLGQGTCGQGPRGGHHQRQSRQRSALELLPRDSG